MATIEFISRPNKTFTATVYDPTVAPFVVLDSNVTVTRDTLADNVYRLTSVRTGWVYIECDAAEDSTRTVGYVNLSKANSLGRYDLLDKAIDISAIILSTRPPRAI